MPVKILKSVGLVLVTIGALIIGFPGPITCIVVWIVLFGLFLVSRFYKPVYLFTDWSWPQFLVTIAGALGIPYLFLILSAGF
jgi:hypothetical protein